MPCDTLSVAAAGDLRATAVEAALAGFTAQQLALRPLGASLRADIVAWLTDIVPTVSRALIAQESARSQDLSGPDLTALRQEVASLDVAGLTTACLDQVPVWFDGPRAPTYADMERARRVAAGTARTDAGQLPDPYTNAQLAVVRALQRVFQRHGFAALTLGAPPVPGDLAARARAYNLGVLVLATRYDAWRRADADASSVRALARWDLAG